MVGVGWEFTPRAEFHTSERIALFEKFTIQK